MPRFYFDLRDGDDLAVDEEPSGGRDIAGRYGPGCRPWRSSRSWRTPHGDRGSGRRRAGDASQVCLRGRTTETVVRWKNFTDRQALVSGLLTREEGATLVNEKRTASSGAVGFGYRWLIR